MFRRHRESATITTPYNKAAKTPVIRASICTGEQVAGFKDKASGRFEEIQLIKTDTDLREFLRQYEVDEADIKREW